MTGTLPDRAASFADRVALEERSRTLRYHELLERSAVAATRLLAGRDDLRRARVAYAVPPGCDYVLAQWAIWRSGGVAVPLAMGHPPAEVARTLDDAEPEAVIVSPDLLDRVAGPAEQRRIPVLQTPALLRPGPTGVLPSLDPARPALMLYTSGTTGTPKGALLTHANLVAQVASLSRAWAWTGVDRILLVLPLHHVHGIVNVLGCALANGAACRIHERFDAERVWNELTSGDLTLFMGVPTLYRRLIAAWEGAEPAQRRRWSSGAGALRLYISGSAALPVSTLERWERITGHRLLERYGMTEIGMGLSNPLEGDRRPGHVGTPLPSVDVRLVDEAGRTVPEGTPGEIQVRGPTVFVGYWGRPEATREAFTSDGWFRSGDLAVVEDGAYRILGRLSVDVIKSGGEKISALEVEDALREHAAIDDVAVVGVLDPEWGERVCAAVVLRPGAEPPTLDALRGFGRNRLAPWKLPRDLRVVPELPRNAMGKVTKPAVASLFADLTAPPDEGVAS